ncbi:DUF1385 domain-containing protein [Bacteriovorax stolpii]|uniref:DUF1385 domain-containing protein n=1 Tax=Bacteriovorax stolpii TaxID=960 RepID=A0A2K9NNL2_BACTC|nr:DUF1385 domain-containing protein [Bacteriovorax stolpii]AUN97110.1 DUF1385 domain-containing protein [Bacteriovorax stolpii]TDP53395.1 uncharacterized protein YqhQ [Bacteriovorax stolpii]
MKKTLLKKLILLVSKQYASIGGQAVIEGVMMRSPNAFVVAVRKPDGSIRLRRDQWYGLSNKLAFLKKPFLRGVLVLVETMANGIVSLNYSANIAMDEENKKEALKKGQTEEEYEKTKKSKEKVSLETFLSIAVSFLFGIGLFVFVPHAATALIEKYSGASWDLQSWQFHAVDGTIKAFIFLTYIWLISFIPDIKKVFQYHGAEHKSISTFEAGEELTIANARKFPTFHPRCGTTFIFFLMFVSIILFAIIFAIIPVGTNSPVILKHLYAILFKVALTFPIAGISYELIKFLGKNPDSSFGRFLSYPGKMLQKLTTKEPDDQQLEIALASIKAVLFLEEKYNLKDASSKTITVDEIDLRTLSDIENSNFKLKDFLEG